MPSHSCICSAYTHRLPKAQAVDPRASRSIHPRHLDVGVHARPRSCKHNAVANLTYQRNAVRIIQVFYPSSTRQVPGCRPRRLVASSMLVIAPVQTVDHGDRPHLGTPRVGITTYIKLIVNLQCVRSKGTYLSYNDRHDH